jgi:hypothetical protein
MAAPIKTLPGRYAKFLTALAGNALVYADITYGATNKWVELATAAAVALGVLAVPNSPAKAPALITLPPADPAEKTLTPPGAGM